MHFNSITFGVFASLVMIFYWLVFNHPSRIKARNIFILAVSYTFYGWWDWRFLGLIIFSSAIDFIVGQRLGEVEESKKKLRKRLLALSLTTNLGLLAAFKYFDFFIESADEALMLFGLSASGLRLEWILPVGISFYTFQTLSYTIDIYRGQLKPTRNIVSFFAFVAFFPQLVAGPIERARLLLPQFEKYHAFNPSMVRSGLLLVVWGLFKKIVIADRLALYVNTVFADPEVLNGPIAISVTIFFTLQLYIDFSAYSEIAIGLARMLGFKLSTNFKRPLLANGFADLWARWHISLTTWFRDYIMIPLRNRPNGKKQRAFNIIVVFFVTGLWHGASWNFVLWGLINGAFLLVFEPLVIRPLYKLPPVISRIMRTGFTTFFMYTALILFRSPDLSTAWQVYTAMFDWSGSTGVLTQLGFTDNEWLIGWFFIVFLLGLEAVIEWKPSIQTNFYQGVGLKRWFAAWTLVMTMILLGAYGLYVLDQQFVYFQF